MNTAMSMPWVTTASRASSHQLRQVTAAMMIASTRVERQQDIGLLSDRHGLAAPIDDCEKEGDAKHHAPKCNHSAAMVFEQAPRGVLSCSRATPLNRVGDQSN